MIEDWIHMDNHGQDWIRMMMEIETIICHITDDT